MDEPRALLVEPLMPEDLVEVRQVIQGITKARWKYQDQVGCQMSLLRSPVEAGRLLLDVCREIGLTTLQMTEALGAALMNEIIWEQLGHPDLEDYTEAQTVDVGGDLWKRLR
jgi:hypothetical protein